tara:strand:+ start:1250 stop:1483 length:234 start_codon:yes stop_codon:yes gene_type:complete
LWSAVEDAAANHEMTVNEFLIDSLKRNVVSPMYGVNEDKMENIGKLAMLDELQLIKSQLETITENVQSLENVIKTTK